MKKKVWLMEKERKVAFERKKSRKEGNLDWMKSAEEGKVYEKGN